MTKCPYCQRPADSHGSINHEGWCEGLNDAGLIVLQRYMLDQRIAQLESALRVIFEACATPIESRDAEGLVKYLEHLDSAIKKAGGLTAETEAK